MPRKPSSLPGSRKTKLASKPVPAKSFTKKSKSNSKRTRHIPLERTDEHLPPITREAPIVAIGASAGGLEAIKSFISELVPNQMSYIIMQHLAESIESPLPRLLRRHSKLSIEEGKDGMRIVPNHIYILPSKGRFGIMRRKLVFFQENENKFFPIDAFFSSLADDIGNKAIGVILSGTGSDGTMGMTAIKAAGGLTFAQDLSAEFEGMPKSAIASGHADFVLAPEAIAQELKRLGDNPVLHAELWSSKPFINNEEALNRIFFMLRNATGIDFSQYKNSTVRRRILRRMVLSGIDKVEQYVTGLGTNPKELQALYNDLLINVTSFFRDEEAFDKLKEIVFPVITAAHTNRNPIRIWVAGCSTGEEAYSIAIALLEYFGDDIDRMPIQIFGTDVSESAIEKARKGIYSSAVIKQLSAERQRKYFKRINDNYQISKTIRELCIFARQNVLKDPPFSRLDLICCRNLLIYLNSTVQRQLIGTLFHALRSGGYLTLGTSETTGLNSDLFSMIDKKNKIYQKKESMAKKIEVMETPHPGLTPRLEFPRPGQEELKQSFDIQKEAERIILTQVAPPSVIINEEMNILHFRGSTRRYLQPAEGTATFNLLRMIAEPLRLNLRTAINRARLSGKPVFKEGLPLEIEGKAIEVTIRVIPFRSLVSRQQFYIILFEEVQSTGTQTVSKKKKKSTTTERHLKMLEEELTETKEYLQRNIEEQDAYTEELKSANEEIQSSNEELQSTNEELETAKEEMQSINEELTTLNDELQIRNSELFQVNNDLSNLLANVNFTVVMVGRDLRIRRFNPKAALTLNLIPTDVGRPIGDINPNVRIESIEAKLKEVIDSLRVHDEQVTDKVGHRYALSIRPYKTAENRIDGAVLIMVDSEP